MMGSVSAMCLLLMTIRVCHQRQCVEAMSNMQANKVHQGVMDFEVPRFTSYIFPVLSFIVAAEQHLSDCSADAGTQRA